MFERLKQSLASTWPLCALCVINFGTFEPHFLGLATFPWDFIGGYHSQAFGWFDNGGMFAPPTWFPWTNLGFPAFLALQSGAWYVPLGLMHVVGVPYTIQTATVFQVLHVLFGAVGTYFLARRVGGSQLVALVVAVGYHFGATFYSNQQHVDIVRAVAWIPWLLFVLHPVGFAKTRWNVLIGAFVLSQLLVAGYPGNIVSAVYACAVWVSMLMWSEIGWRARRRYMLEVTLVVIAGSLMAMPKWLPLLLNGSAGLLVQHLPSAPFVASHLLTLITPYDVSGLPSDRSMRSLWLPLTCIWGAAFASRRDRITWIALVFVCMAIFMGMFVPSYGSLSRLLPGMQVSRFPLTDWRPVLQLSLILGSISGWSAVLSGRCTPTKILLGTVGAFGLGTALLLMAVGFGFNAGDLFRVILALFVMLVVTVWFAVARLNWGESRFPTIILGAVLVVMTVVDGYQYQISQPTLWRADWNADVRTQVFGTDIDGMIRHPQAIVKVDRRPWRMVIGTDPISALTQRKSSLYNRCWYEHSYCVFGYDNVRMSAPHEMFLAAVAKPDGQALLDFVRRPQQLLALVQGDADLTTAMIGTDDYAPVVGNSTGISLAFRGYSADSIRYRVSTPRDVRLVANEIWWPGWKVDICNGDRCRRNIDTQPTLQGLRSWDLKKGAWDVVVHFVGPPVIPGYLCALFGLVLALFTPFPIAELWGRRGRLHRCPKGD